MKQIFLAGVVLTVLVPAVAAGQSAGVAVRAGTLGLGGEAAVQLASVVGLRGGIGFFPFTVDGTYSDVDYSVSPTSPLANIGIDLFAGRSGLRIGGGILFVSRATTLEANYTGTVDIGDQTYSGAEVGTLTGELDHGGAAPYAVLGFGRAAGRGVGVFIDLGAAFLGEPALSLRASGPAAQQPQFQQDLERERQQAEADARDYLRILPIISVGVRFGVR